MHTGSPCHSRYTLTQDPVTPFRSIRWNLSSGGRYMGLRVRKCTCIVINEDLSGPTAHDRHRKIGAFRSDEIGKSGFSLKLQSLISYSSFLVKSSFLTPCTRIIRIFTKMIRIDQTPPLKPDFPVAALGGGTWQDFICLLRTCIPTVPTNFLEWNGKHPGLLT